MHATIRFGSRGADVQYLQNQLNKLLTPHPNLRVDGDFGRRTYEAVQRFQIAKNLGVDGIVGPKTWKALQGGIVPAPPISSIPSGNSSNAPWMAIATNEIGQKEIPGSLHTIHVSWNITRPPPCKPLETKRPGALHLLIGA